MALGRGATLHVDGLDGVEAALRSLGPGYAARLIGPGLGAAANVVRRRAARRDFGFTDRRGAGQRVLPSGRRATNRRGRDTQGRFRSLRASIRARRIRGRYGGRSFRSGGAAVFAGGDGARQAYLVEAGHGGPFPARPHPYLIRAMLQSRDEQNARFQDSVQRRFPTLTRRETRRASSRALDRRNLLRGRIGVRVRARF